MDCMECFPWFNDHSKRFTLRATLPINSVHLHDVLLYHANTPWHIRGNWGLSIFLMGTWAGNQITDLWIDSWKLALPHSMSSTHSHPFCSCPVLFWTSMSFLPVHSLMCLSCVDCTACVSFRPCVFCLCPLLDRLCLSLVLVLCVPAFTGEFVCFIFNKSHSVPGSESQAAFWLPLQTYILTSYLSWELRHGLQWNAVPTFAGEILIPQVIPFI